VKIAVIIPALNEASEIAATLARCGPAIVVDGGSTDGTPDIAAGCGATVLHVGGGRAAQMNAGAAAAADADAYVFLHADTWAPESWQPEVEHLLAEPGVVGAFRLGIRDASLPERLIAAAANLRSRMFGTPYGDQMLCVTRATFETIGGFREWPIMEDHDFVRRVGNVRLSALAVATSSRRWRRLGPWRTLWRNQMVLLGHRLGVPLATLARYYRSAK
jgi:rSAM/selenodomain-associated transferase 2